MERNNLKKRKSLDGSSPNINNSNKKSNIASPPSSPLNNNNNRIFKNNKKHRKSLDRISNSPKNTTSTTTTTSTTIDDLELPLMPLSFIDTSKKRTESLLPGTSSSSNEIKAEKIENKSTNRNQNSHIEDDDRLVRVYADGIYDLFHFGHARSLQQAKSLFKNTYLIVGVCNDEITHKLKGKTVMNGEERAESLRHCRWVDEVVENAPWVVTQEFIDQHNIDYVSHGEDLCLDKDGNDIYQFVKDQGKFRTIKRTDGISTSDIILRIVKDYDSYVMRNLSRGYTGKQMNVGVLKEKSLQFEEKINQIKSKVKLWSDQTENNIHSFLQRFSKRIPMNWEKKLLTSPTLSDGSNDDSILNESYQDNVDNNSDIQSPPLTSSSTPTSPIHSKKSPLTSKDNSIGLSA
ncbi:hypothetical protein ACTFIY_001328 [Dictyostelium cf. discoideum]